MDARVDRADASGSVESVPPEEHELPHYWAIYALDEVERWIWIADVLTERAARLVAGAYLLQASPWWECCGSVRLLCGLNLRDAPAPQAGAALRSLS